MDNTTFENLVKEIRAASMDTLVAKNAKYATDSDRLHNFVAGGDVMGGTAAQACWGYLTKHLVALRDKVERNDFSDREDLKEKCQDAINYIVFLWCIGNDTRATSARFPGNETRAKEAHLKCARAEDEPVEQAVQSFMVNPSGDCEQAVQPFTVSPSGDCEQGLGLSPEERERYEAGEPVTAPVTYRDMAKKLAPYRVGPGESVRGCPSDLLEGAPGPFTPAHCQSHRCLDCWNLPYKGERARDDIGGT